MYIVFIFKIEETVELYREYAKFPQVTKASLSALSTEENIILDTVQSQRDLERVETIKFSKTYCVKGTTNGECQVVYRSSPQEINNE